MNFDLLAGIGKSVAMTVEASSAGGGDLRRGAGLDLYFKREVVAGKDSSGDVMEMHEARAVFLRERAHDAPRRFLRVNLQAGRAAVRFAEPKGETGGQLMNRRVSSEP